MARNCNVPLPFLTVKTFDPWLITAVVVIPGGTCGASPGDSALQLSAMMRPLPSITATYV
jgi:hypothetical protein